MRAVLSVCVKSSPQTDEWDCPQGLEGLLDLQGVRGAAASGGASAGGEAATPAGAPRRQWTCGGACQWTPWACP